jgi:hypothetical protein
MADEDCPAEVEDFEDCTDVRAESAMVQFFLPMPDSPCPAFPS